MSGPDSFLKYGARLSRSGASLKLTNYVAKRNEIRRPCPCNAARSPREAQAHRDPGRARSDGERDPLSDVSLVIRKCECLDRAAQRDGPGDGDAWYQVGTLRLQTRRRERVRVPERIGRGLLH